MGIRLALRVDVEGRRGCWASARDCRESQVVAAGVADLRSRRVEVMLILVRDEGAGQATVAPTFSGSRGRSSRRPTIWQLSGESGVGGVSEVDQSAHLSNMKSEVL